MSIYLIDFENVGEAGFNGIEHLKKEDVIIVFYSKNTSKKISIDIFGNNINQAEIHFFKAEVGSKNALDFQLVSYLGFLIQKRTENEEFCIVSKDNGYSPLAPFWKRYGVTVKQAIDLAGNTVPVVEPKKKTKAEKEKESKAEEINKAVSKILKKKEVAEVVRIVIDSKSKEELKEKLTVFLKNDGKVTNVLSNVKSFIK